MQYLIDSYEQPMSRTRHVDRRIVPCRGRMSEAVTNIRTAFTSLELDALAPLTNRDRHILSQQQDPPGTVKAHIAARIAVARQLKYGPR